MSIIEGRKVLILMFIIPGVFQYDTDDGLQNFRHYFDTSTTHKSDFTVSGTAGGILEPRSPQDVADFDQEIADRSDVTVAGTRDGRLEPWDLEGVPNLNQNTGDTSGLGVAGTADDVLESWDPKGVANLDQDIADRSHHTLDQDTKLLILPRSFSESDRNSSDSENLKRKSSNSLARNKRTLTFTDPSILLLIFGIGTPLQLDRESVIVGAFTKMIYVLPTNSSDFTKPGAYFSRTKSRWSIYKVLESAAELYGFVDGKGCLLRAICEVAAAPFDLRHGLFGQMVQAFLTPSSTSEAYDKYEDREYHAAERLGKHVGENCHALYPECESSVLDVFSTTAPATTTSTTTTTAATL